MKIVVINGSPKGNDLSITIQHIKYLQKEFSENDFEIIPVSKKIKKIENDKNFFDSIMLSIKESKIVIWAFPVYFYMIPGQLKRFIEIIFDRKIENIFNGKYSTAISTSGGVFDYPAHEYIHAVSEDLGMNFMSGFSFNSVTEKDLLKPVFQESYKSFFNYLIYNAKNNIKLRRQNNPIEYSRKVFNPKINYNSEVKRKDKKILLLTDHLAGTNLDHMIKFFINEFDYIIEIININEINIKTGCIGCVQCQFTGKCIINDDIKNIIEDKMIHSDGIIFAAAIKDRHLSSQWKMFIDRSIFISNKPVFRDKYTLFLISGPLAQVRQVLDFMNIYGSVRSFENIGFLSDDNRSNDDLTDAIKNIARDFEYYIENKIKKPFIFYNKAYHLSIRDIIYTYSSAKKSTYNYFKKHKLFDYPHKKLNHFIQHHLYNFVFNFPVINKKLKKNVLNIAVKPFKKFLQD